MHVMHIGPLLIFNKSWKDETSGGQKQGHFLRRDNFYKSVLEKNVQEIILQIVCQAWLNLLTLT